MATKIKLKKSGLIGNTPASGDLEYGELALNYADGILYYKDSSNNIQQISGTRANTFETVNANGSLIIADSNTDILTLLAGDSVYITGDGITDTITIGARSNDTFLSVATDTLATANIVNGVYSIATAAYAKANAPITIKEINSSNSYVINTFSDINTIQFDADSGMAVVDESNNTVTIQLNSTFKNWNVDGNTGLVAFGLDTVNFIAGDGITISANNSNTPKSLLFEVSKESLFISDTYVANGAQTIYQLSGVPQSSNSLFVFVDGVTQVPSIDYTVYDDILTFTAPPESNGIIEVRSVISVQIQNTTSNLISNSTELYVSNSSMAFSSGGFSTPTDSISKTYILRGTTTSNTENELFLNGINNRIQVPANTTVFYTADVVARRTDATNESAGYHLKGVVDNFNGIVADVGNLYEVIVAEDDAEIIIDARSDNTNNTINFYATGSTGKTIRWTALVRTVEVAQ